MPATVVVGTQWGDEGKVKFTDLVAKETSLVVRYQGGHNAGHHQHECGERHGRVDHRLGRWWRAVLRHHSGHGSGARHRL